jgi:branched-chain amino acid aminotransferase
MTTNTGPLVWLNGHMLSRAEPCLSAFDRGFALGDGVFETIRARWGRLLWFNDHLARLRQGAALFGIPMPLADDTAEEGLGTLLAAWDQPESVVRLTLSRGPSDRRGLWPADDPAKPTLLATVAKLPPARAPLRLVITDVTRRNEQSPLSRIKSVNYGDNLLARRDAALRGVDDALILSGSGNIVCATVGNLFLQVDGRWRTPPISEGALPGLARQRLLSILDVEEKVISPFDLSLANAGFVSNSLGVSEIREIEGYTLQDSRPLFERLQIFE